MSNRKTSRKTSQARRTRTGDPAEEVTPGMEVEATEGDLGEEDVSKPRVKEVQRDPQGNIEKVVVEKGAIFKKTLEVPADRVQSVEPAQEPVPPAATGKTADEQAREQQPTDGKVMLRTSKEEIKALSARGAEELEESAPEQAETLLEKVEQVVPTTEGLRRLEAQSARIDARRSRSRRANLRRTRPAEATAAAEAVETEAADTEAAETETEAEVASAKHSFSWRDLGPGLLSGMAGNDSSAVTSYSVNGATNGYGQLWLMLLSTPLYQAVQYTCAKVGRITQQGLAELLREHYGRKVAVPASLILIVSNTALIAADLVAIGTGLQLFTGLAWEWFVVPVAVILWYLTVYQNFGVIKRIFLAMSLAFAAYLITGLFSGANWGLVLKGTFVPQIGLNFASISSAVALLGATVSPYTIYWQVQGEKEEKRAGKRKQQLREAALDIAAGTISGNLVAYAIIVCTSATLFTHHESVSTAADAARALEPLLGPYAKYLFALGFIGAGLVAIPVLLASTSYAVSGTFGWPASLWKKPWQNEGFYLILTGALIVSLVVALLGFDPIQLMFSANVLQGILAPVLVVLLFLVGNNRKIMQSYRLGRLTNIGLIAIALVMSAATILLFYGLLTGQGG